VNRQDAFEPVRFISTEVSVSFTEPPALEKRPPCPEAFAWDGTRHHVAAVLSEWHDYSRRGRMAHNMRDTHLATARRRGSWGVGRHYFRVLTEEGRIFDLYYDRAPGSIDAEGESRKGSWTLFRELRERSS
jgi:hypothetical protein